MITKLIILGGHIQALGLARQAAEKGVSVYVITMDAFSVAHWSRSVKQMFRAISEMDMMKIIYQLGDKSTMLFPTSDDYIFFIESHRVDLERLLYVALPESKIVKLFANKRQTYRFAERENISHPKSWYPNSWDDVKEISKIIEYPCVVKPAIMYSFHKKIGKKAFLCRTPHDLFNCVQVIENNGFIIPDILVQEYLSGGAEYLYSFGTFAVNGQSLVDIQVNRKRQNPMDFGNSTTYCVTCDHPELVETAKRILSVTCYTGMAEIEFMYDKGEYKFLEINTRAWKWHAITNQRDFSFIGTWLDFLNGKEIKKGTTDFAVWVERLTDSAVIVKECFRNRMRLKDAIVTYKPSKEYAVWNWKDPMPAIMYLLQSPMLYLKRY